MNKRQLQKQKTRKQIIKVAREIFSSKGFTESTTAEIARSAGIAHGTLFLHFPNKENLIVTVLDHELEELSEIITRLVDSAGTFKQLLSGYLDFISSREDIFCVLARELPLYDPELRRRILFRESMLRSHFHSTMEKGIEEGIFKNIDVPSALLFLFGTVNHLLALKPIFVSGGSVIEKFKAQIIKTFLEFLNKGDR